MNNISFQQYQCDSIKEFLGDLDIDKDCFEKISNEAISRYQIYKGVDVPNDFGITKDDYIKILGISEGDTEKIMKKASEDLQYLKTKYSTIFNSTEIWKIVRMEFEEKHDVKISNY